MLMAVFILALGVVGIASLFIASTRLGTVASVERDASDVASTELEIVRSASFDSIGISPSAAGYRAQVDGLPTVTEEDANVVEPMGAVAIDGVDFVITRSVVWATLGADTNAYKIVTITVEWQTVAGQRSIDLQTGIHEGLSGA